jgi:hypothetical protein
MKYIMMYYILHYSKIINYSKTSMAVFKFRYCFGVNIYIIPTNKVLIQLKNGLQNKAVSLNILSKRY